MFSTNEGSLAKTRTRNPGFDLVVGPKRRFVVTRQFVLWRGLCKTYFG